MTPEEFKLLIEGMTYKPNTTIEVETSEEIEASFMGWRVTITQMLPSSLIDGALDQPIVQRVYFSDREVDSLTELLIKDKLHRNFVNMEVHELQEWLKFDGVRYLEPHPEMRKVT